MSSAIGRQIQPYWCLMRFDRPIGILLLWWPTACALWLAAGGMPRVSLLLIFILGTVIMRAAGCVINDIADRAVDAQVQRTRSRPLAQGSLTVLQAQIIFVVLGLLGLGLVLLLNPLCFKLAWVGFGLACSYPFMKRFTHWPQFVLGITFSWGILMAYAAVQGQLPLTAWLWFAANVSWIVAYDTQYAMVDRDDDVHIGVKSTAVLFGRWDRAMIGLFQLLTLLGWASVAVLLALPMFFWWAWMLAALGFIYQQYLIVSRRREKCFTAFLQNNWVGLVLFLGCVLSLMR